MKRNILVGSLVFILSFSFVYAEISTKNISVIQSFKQSISVPKIEISVPTVVEISIPDQVYSPYFGVYNQTQDKFEPYTLIQGSISGVGIPLTVPQNIYTSTADIQSTKMFDGNFQTSVQFDVNEEGTGYTEIQYTFAENIKSNSLHISLEQYVSLPNLITIKTIENGQEKIVVSKVRPNSSTINFPETSSKIWKFEINYSQPLRVNELQINNLNSIKTPTSIRFLAQPNKEYQIYAEPDSIINQQTGERPNLSSNDDVKIVQALGIKQNTSYKLADTDADTVPDIYDNCVMISNTDQLDVNKNNRGDVCDDFDKDGVINSRDNCVNEPNIDQRDIDNDTIGDMCDGVESRLTEKYPWVVWGGIIFAALLFLGLFAVAIRKIRFNTAEIQSSTEIDQGPKV
jgi:hypothetical protein